MTAAQTTTATTDQPRQAEPPASKGAVAVLTPPRLPYHPVIEERFGIDRAAWKALVEAVFPMAKTTDAVCLALSYCRARRLDPFKRVVHIVPIWDNESRGYVETVWPGIAEHRTTAFRTKQYGGSDACQFGETKTLSFKGETKKGKVEVTVNFPEWAQLTVYRLIDGQRVPIPGPRVYWLETYSRLGRTDVPNDMWQRRPVGQLEKCAEAAALRRAFPEELGDEATSDEAGAYQGAANAKDVTPEEARPTRAGAAQTVVDATATESTDEEAAAAHRKMDKEAAGEVETDEPAEAEIVNPDTGEVIRRESVNAEQKTQTFDASKPILPALRPDNNWTAWKNDALPLVEAAPVEAMANVEAEMAEIERDVKIPGPVHTELMKAIKARRGRK